MIAHAFNLLVRQFVYDNIPQYQYQIPRRLDNMMSFVIIEPSESFLARTPLTNAMIKGDILQRLRWCILQQYTP